MASMVTEQASASVHLYPYLSDTLGDARLTGAARVIEGYYTQTSSKLRIHAVIEDLASRRNVATLDAESDLGGGNLAAASESMAYALDSRTRKFGTQNGAAIRAWGEALTAEDKDQKIADLRRAVKADPNFGMAYVDLVTLLLASGDADALQQVLKQADDHLSEFTDLERARLEFLESGIRQNPRQRKEALVALSRLVSTDPKTINALAETEVNARRFDSAAELFKNALAIEPNSSTLLNELGYAEAYRGKLDAATAALERYRVLEPNQPNALDSLGEVHFIAGRFADAERYFLDAQRMQPGYLGGSELLKAAQARYLAGDRGGADALYAQFDQFRRGAHDPLADIRKAEWLHITGRATEAVQTAQAASAGPNPDLAAYALCHLSLWAMDSGDKGKAADFSARAIEAAQNPGVRNISALCRLIAAPVAQMPELAQAYSSLFAKDAAKAAAVLKPMYDRTPTMVDGEVRTLYAWALADSGQTAEARRLVERYYIPMGAAGEALFTTEAFPHFVALRTKLVK
jgi:tetratricopeptide (TPR) repeat protein